MAFRVTGDVAGASNPTRASVANLRACGVRASARAGNRPAHLVPARRRAPGTRIGLSCTLTRTVDAETCIDAVAARRGASRATGKGLSAAVVHRIAANEPLPARRHAAFDARIARHTVCGAGDDRSPARSAPEGSKHDNATQCSRAHAGPLARQRPPHVPGAHASCKPLPIVATPTTTARSRLRC